MPKPFIMRHCDLTPIQSAIHLINSLWEMVEELDNRNSRITATKKARSALFIRHIFRSTGSPLVVHCINLQRGT
jgi:hypothetical protein